MFVTIIWIGVIVVSARAQESCIGFSSNFGNCYDCAYTHYRSPNMTFDKLVYPNDCLPRKNESLKLVFFISSKKCQSQVLCNGSSTYPYDEINKALWEAHKKANEYMSSSINIYLLSGPHYILRKNLPQVSFPYFRRINASVTIQPCYCSNFNISGCLRDLELVEILLKTDNFVLFVSNSLRISNIYMNGTDLHLISRSDYNQATNCYNLEKICCGQNDTNIAYSTSKPCSLLKKDSYITPMDQWYNQTGFINIEAFFDDPWRMTPYFHLENASFVDMYTSKAIYGWVSIILLGGNIRNYVRLKNINFINGKLIRGLAYIDKFENINTNAAFLKNLWKLKTGEENNLILENFFIAKYNIYDLSIGGLYNQNDLGIFTIQEFKGKFFINNMTYSNFATTDAKISLISLKTCLEININLLYVNSTDNLLILYVFKAILKIINSSIQNFQALDCIICDGNCKFYIQNFYLALFTGKPQKYSRFLAITDGELTLRDIKIEVADYFSMEYYSSKIDIFNFTYGFSTLVRSFIKLLNCDITINILQLIDIIVTFTDLFEYRGVVPNSITISQISLQKINVLVKVAVFRWISGVENSALQAENVTVVNSSLSIIFSLGMIGRIFFSNFQIRDCFETETDNLGSSFLSATSVEAVVLNNITFNRVFTDSYLIQVSFCFISNECFINITNINVIDSERAYSDWISISLSYADLNLIRVINLMNRNLEEGPKRLFAFYSLQKLTVSSLWFIIYNDFYQARGILETYNIIKTNITDLFIEKLKDNSEPASSVPVWFCTVLSNYRGQFIYIQNVIISSLQGLERESSIAYKNGFLSFYGFDSETFLWENDVKVYLSDIVIEECRGWPNGVLGFVNIDYVLMQNITFKKCSSVKGGALHVNWASTTLIFSLNFQDTKALYGGSIYLSNIKTLKAKLLFAYRTWAEEGGLFYLTYIQSGIIEEIRTNSSSSIEGGLFYMVEVNLNLRIIYAYYSEAKEQGGIVYLNSGVFILEQAIFHSMKARRGGALFVLLAESVSVYKVIIKNASVLDKGASMLFDEVSKTNLENIEMSGNFGLEAKGNIVVLTQTRNMYSISNIFCFQNGILFGSCIFYSSNVNMSITNLTMAENSGSLLQFSSHSTSFITVNNLYVLSNNLWGYNDEIRTINSIVFHDCKINIFGESWFINNSAEEPVLYFEKSDVKLSDSVFYDNRILSLINHYSILHTISGYLKLSNIKYGTIINNSKSFVSFINVKGAKFELEQSEIEACMSLELACITLDGSQEGFINKCKFRNNKADRAGTLLLRNTRVIINNSYFSNNSYALPLTLKLIDSLFPAVKLRAGDILAEGNGLHSLSIYNSYFYFYDEYLSSSAYFLEKIDIGNCIFKSFKQKGSGLLIFNTNFAIMNSIFRNLKADEGAAIKAFAFESQNFTALIQSSEFSNNTADLGGAILFIGHILPSISNTSFNFNSAKGENAIGGGVYFVCLACSFIEIELTENIFNSNSADWFGPTVFSQAKISSSSRNNIFINNTDAIGFTAEFSCFPLTVELSEINWNLEKNGTKLQSSTVISGQDFDFNLTVYDHLGNLLIFDDFSVSTIKKVTDDTYYIQILRGFSKSEKGKHTFTKLRINKKPNTTFSLEVGVEIDELRFLPRAIERHPLNNISFVWNLYSRPCFIGEILIKGDFSCYYCPAGQYSIIDPMAYEGTQLCLPCPRNAVCRGGSDISPMAGFWRAGRNGTKIVECLSHSFCLGGIGDQLNDEESKPNNILFKGGVYGRCLIHHSGNLCYKCDTGFARSSVKGECEICASNAKMNLKLAIAVLFVVLYIFIQIKLAFSGKGTNAIGIMMKQLLTHYQIIHMISVLDMGWTAEIINFFKYQEYLSFMSEDFLSLDCIYSEVNDEMIVLRVIAANMIPVFFNILMLLLYMVVFAFRRLKGENLAFEEVLNLLRLSNVIIIYIFFPEILRKCFTLINCIVIDQSGTMVMTQSPGLKCWESRHYEIILRVALPGILIWGIFIPILALYLLLKNKQCIKDYISCLSRTGVNQIDIRSKFNREVKFVNFSQLKMPNFFEASPSTDKGSPSNEKGGRKINIASGNSSDNSQSKRNSSLVDTLFIHSEKKNSYSFKIPEKRGGRSQTSRSMSNYYQSFKSAVSLRFVYRGYREQYLYWEIVIFLRKFCLIIISSVTGLFPNNVKATILLVILSFFLFLQMRFKPFEISFLNKIELLSLLVTFVTANIGVFLYSEDLKLVNMIFVIILVSLNFFFLLYWVVTFLIEARRLYLERKRKIKQNF